jgi:predicted hotdog family 3-hydroxylacyl-ACP dehydratase
VSQANDLATEADRILAAHGGIATTAAIEMMRQAIAAWLAARGAARPPTDVTPDARHSRRLLMEAMDRMQAGRGIG